MGDYVIDEYHGYPNGTDFEPQVTFKFLLLSQIDDKAMVNVTVMNTDSVGSEMYLYLRKTDHWRLSMWRSLTETKYQMELLRELEGMTEEDKQEMIDEAATDTASDFWLFRNKQEFEYLLGNARLVMATDTQMILHFKKHENEFNRLKEPALKRLAELNAEELLGIKLIPDKKKEYQKLLIQDVQRGTSSKTVNCVMFVISSTTINEQGYLYAPNPTNVPHNSPDNFILVRPLGNGWYLYKYIND